MKPDCQTIIKPTNSFRYLSEIRTSGYQASRYKDAYTENCVPSSSSSSYRIICFVVGMSSVIKVLECSVTVLVGGSGLVVFRFNGYSDRAAAASANMSRSGLRGPSAKPLDESADGDETFE